MPPGSGGPALLMASSVPSSITAIGSADSDSRIWQASRRYGSPSTSTAPLTLTSPSAMTSPRAHLQRGAELDEERRLDLDLGPREHHRPAAELEAAPASLELADRADEGDDRRLDRVVAGHLGVVEAADEVGDAGLGGVVDVAADEVELGRQGGEVLAARHRL